jgi:hypothetical protein
VRDRVALTAAVPVVVEAVFEALDAPAEAVAFGVVNDVAAGALEEVEGQDEEVGDGIFASSGNSTC